MNNKKIIYIVNHLAFLVSHRFNLVKKIIKNKNKVIIFCGKSASYTMEKEAVKFFKSKNIIFKRFNFSSSGFTIINDLLCSIKINKILKNENPDIVHAVSAKGIWLTILSSFFLKNIKVIISISGLGLIFIKKNFFFLIVKFFYFNFLKLYLKNHKYFFIVQNLRDFNFLQKKLNLKKNNIYLLNGSGVNLKKFKPSRFDKRENIILFPARIVIEKGIIEFCEVSKILKKKYKNWRFVAAGTLDYSNSGSFDRQELEDIIHSYKSVEFIGYQRNLLKILKKTSIVCLPSHNEGLSKSLIESLVMKIPIVTTNISGCKELVQHNKTGFLFLKKNNSQLLFFLEKLIKDKSLREKFSKNYLRFNFKKFSEENIVNNHLKIYKKLLMR